jgi:hypothetical protein
VYLRPVGLNDLDLLALVVDRLDAAGAGVLVFGGWAEELLSLASPRPHADIDLLLPAATFAPVDRFLAAAADAPEEIRAKRFAHKRAFRLNGVTIEITLVEHDCDGPVTRFWGDIAFRWLVPLGQAEPASSMVRPLPVVTQENLVHYRRFHRVRQPWRWHDPASIIA